MTIVFLGIDLAKNVFALHGVDAAGRACLVRPSVRRDQLLEMVAKLPPMHHRHGGVFGRAPLGAAVRRLWSYRMADDPEVSGNLSRSKDRL